MQYETRYGLRVEHSYDAAREYIEADPDTIKFHGGMLCSSRSHMCTTR